MTHVELLPEAMEEARAARLWYSKRSMRAGERLGALDGMETGCRDNPLSPDSTIVLPWPSLVTINAMGERRFTQAELEGEVWAPIPDTLGTYAASSLGRIKNLKPSIYGRSLGEGNILAERPDDQGYLHVNLRIGTEQVSATVGALMLTAFVGPRPTDEHVACFIDGIKSNLTIRNLAWYTHVERLRITRDRGAVPHRPYRLLNGVIYYQCRGCKEWKPADGFHPLKQTYSRRGNPMSRCGRNSECRQCCNVRRVERRRSAAKNGGRMPSLLEQIWPMLFELDKLDIEINDPTAPTPAHRIRTARKFCGISQREVARRAGLRPDAIERVERGNNIPRPKTLEKIIAALRGCRSVSSAPAEAR